MKSMRDLIKLIEGPEDEMTFNQSADNHDAQQFKFEQFFSALQQAGVDVNQTDDGFEPVYDITVGGQSFTLELTAQQKNGNVHFQ